ncbi:MAG TPA: hypothetical protein VGH08_10715 [Chthoniobacterales bacterium]
MNQIKAIQLGVIALCMATTSLSLAQTFRVRTSGGNQTVNAATTAPRVGASSGNAIRVPQVGINPGRPMNVGVSPYVGAHIVTNAGVQTGINNQAIGISGASTGRAASIGNSRVVPQTGMNASTGMNTNAGAQTGKAASGGTGAKSTLPRIILESTPSPILATPSPALTPIPVPTPIPSPSVGPTPTVAQ